MKNPTLNTVNISFHFPTSKSANPENFLETLLLDLKPTKEAGYAGYKTKKALSESMEWRFEDIKTIEQAEIKEKTKKIIEKEITNCLNNCFKILSIENKTLYIYIFPWIGPYDKSDVKMGYVSGFMPHKNVLHIFLSPELFSTNLLRQTIAHEYNHTVFFEYHKTMNPNSPSSKSTILDVLVWEGLAETFSKEITGLISPLLTKYTSRQVLNLVNKLEPIINTELDDSNTLYEDIFFGGNGYKKLTGYSLGFQLIQSFRERNRNTSWTNIIKVRPEKIYREAITAQKK